MPNDARTRSASRTGDTDSAAPLARETAARVGALLSKRSRDLAVVRHAPEQAASYGCVDWFAYRNTPG